MASGSQTYSGSCADLPVAPTNSSSAMAVITAVADLKSAGLQRRANFREADRADAR